MKRRQFLNKLIKISQLNEFISPLHDSPSLCCKPSKIIDRQIKKQMPAINTPKNKKQIICQDILSIKQKQVIILHQNRPSSAIRQLNKNQPRNINQRFKTTPNQNTNQSPDSPQEHPQLKIANSQKNIQSRKLSNFSLQARQIQYLQIKQYTPTIQHIKLNQNSIIIKQRPKAAVFQKKFSQNIAQFNYKSQSTRQKQIQNMNINQNTKAKQSQILLTRHQSYQQQYNKRFYKQQSPNKAEILATRKQINKNYNKHFNPPPKITAKSYFIYQINIQNQSHSSKVICSFNSKNSQQIASLTKIMTCLLVIQICKKYCLDKYAQKITIGKLEANIGGTTANLQIGQIYTVNQLLYGLMLPSGNDASIALAVWAGGKLLQNQLLQNYPKKITKGQKYIRFLNQMNKKAKQINMTKTNYANSHGLMNQNNKSCAYDVAILCQQALKNQHFRQIIKTKEFVANIQHSKQQKYLSLQPQINLDQNQKSNININIEYQNSSINSKNTCSTNRESCNSDNYKQTIRWQNTHKLLHLKPKEYFGIKTGFTTAAGPCLSSFIQIQQRQFIIVVLSCGKMSLRFKQTQILRKWLYKHLNIKRANKKNLKEVQQCLQEEQIQCPDFDNQQQIQD